MTTTKNSFLSKAVLTLLITGLFVALTLPTLSAKAEDNPKTQAGTMTVTARTTDKSGGGGEATHDWVKNANNPVNDNGAVTDDQATQKDAQDCNELGEDVTRYSDYFNSLVDDLLTTGNYSVTLNRNNGLGDYYVATLYSSSVRWNFKTHTNHVTLDLGNVMYANSTFVVINMSTGRPSVGAASALKNALTTLQNASAKRDECLKAQIGDLPVEGLK